MIHLDLFSGIGGFSLAAQWVWGEDHNIHAFVEIDPFCQKVLKKHWPDVPIISDIKEYKHDGTAIDLLTGGFPCQPFSSAGKRRGKEDDRYLWPTMFRVIKEVKPTWIIGENVDGIYNLALKETIFDLETERYVVEVFSIPACAIQANHQRKRFFIIAYTKSIYGKGVYTPLQRTSNKLRGCFRNDAMPKLCRVDDGIPSELDRLKSLGNAIVPQCVVPIMQAIKEIGRYDPNHTTSHQK